MPSSIFSDNVRDLSTTPTTPAPKPLSSKNLAFLHSIESAYPDFVFKKGKKFLFRPKKTVFYLKENDHFPLLLLHELAHALLGHFSYQTSLERLKIERDAWNKTRSLCEEHSIPFDESFVEAELNSYRDWLHQKTLCKTCGLTCVEVSPESLFCPFCQKIYQK